MTDHVRIYVFFVSIWSPILVKSVETCSEKDPVTWKSARALGSRSKSLLQVVLNHSNDVNTLLLFAPTI